MSGPKTSHYTLTPEQRRILEEQRRISIEREMLAKLQGDIRSVIVDAERIIEQLEPLYAEIGADTATLIQTQKICEVAKNALSQVATVSDKDGSARLREINQNLSMASRKLTTATKTVAADYASADKAFRRKMADRIDAGFDFTFEAVGDTTSVNSSPFAAKVLSELEGISALSITDEQKSRMDAINAKFTEIDDPDFLKNFYAMTVVPFAKECQAYHDAYTTYGAEYERKLCLYRANAQKIGVAIESVPFSADAISILDAKIKETEEIIQRHDEQAYISKCVDEAMQEMGYSVAGNREIIRRNGKRFRNELYLFDEGTAVNVTYSSDGQITMELGGIGMDDRLPTEAESASLASDMRTFCDDYYEIERRLLKKGIVTKRISILPPVAQYAQIINVSDYNMSTEVSEYEAKGTKKRTAESKTQKIGG